MEFIDDKIWKPVHLLPGFECCIEYYVNDTGDIKSTKGQIERLLKQRVNKNGYRQVNLTQRIGRRKTITVTVHKLVALAFLDAPTLRLADLRRAVVFCISMDVKLTTPPIILNGLK